MAKTLLNYGDYEGALPQGWIVLEVPPGMKLVKEVESDEMIRQLADSKLLINQTARVFAVVNMIDPELFKHSDVNWGSFMMKITRSSNTKDLGPEFSKLKVLLEGYSKKYNVTILL